MKFISPSKTVYLNIIILGLAQTSITLAEKMPHSQDTRDTYVAQKNQSSKSPAIVRLAEQWAKLLDDLTENAPRLSTLFSSKNLKLKLVTGNIDTHEELQNWLTLRRKQLQSSQHIIQNMKISKNKDNTFTLEFEFLVEEKRKNGLLEISRLKEKWRVFISDAALPLILEISESYLPPQTHSGARIQC